LPLTIDFGDVMPGSTAEHVIRLTWPGSAPAGIHVDTKAPLTSEVTYSNTNRSRVALRLAVDWNAPPFVDAEKPLRSFDARLVVRWDEEDEATVRVTGSIVQPVRVAAGPPQLDFGSVRLRQLASAELTLRASRTIEVSIDSSAWLYPADSRGRRMASTFRLDGQVPLILTVAVDWAPILEKGAESIAAHRPIKPSGRIKVAWDGGELAVPVTMLVATK
jgi:hypothetical protein